MKRGPSATTAASSNALRPATRVSCPGNALPLRAESVARAADEARIEAPALYRGSGPAVVELAWQAKFRLQVWAATPFRCSDKLRRRTVVVDLLFPKMLPNASLSEGVVFVCRFPTGYRVWSVAH
jgi:hypothetical protein